MRTRTKILIYCIVFLSTAMFTYGVLSPPEPSTFYVEEEYKDQFAATCAVVESRDTEFERGGTGVLLSNGRILTAKHVVDANENGFIELEERDVLIKFYYPKEFSLKGRVVYAPPQRLLVAMGFDFVVIQPDELMSSNIKLASIEDHLSVAAGAQIYTIGRMDINQLHIIFGNQSTDVDGPYLYDRTTIPIWYGNSGGGVFTRDDGQLIGIMTIKKDAGPFGPQLWSGYMSATYIRFYLMDIGAEHFIQSIQDTTAFKIQSFIIICLASFNCFLGVYFGAPILCKRVRSMQRADACV